ncbi:unnamed protein product [Mytilus edulis]|uniref:B box-type domain-containing protein n=1 Tax=Mytilus edulis TaxID=6550 RepID=A0A8S3QWZ1_MYTED|nr:unnamed protein product [Mytilus edulis]
MAQSALETCEICSKALSIDYCKECEQLFCNNCKLMHLRMKLSQNHTFKNVDHQEVKLNLCDEHNLGYILYCEECSSLVCKTCIIENHKGHELGDIAEKTIGMLTEVSLQLEKCSDDIQEAHRNKCVLKDQLKVLEKDGTSGRVKIRNRGNQLKSYVDRIVNYSTRNSAEKNKRKSRK